MPEARAPAVASTLPPAHSGDPKHRGRHVLPMRAAASALPSTELSPPVAWDVAWRLAILIMTVLTVLLAVTDLPGPVRPAVTVVFALSCPGMAFVRLLRLDDPLAELTLGIATSVAVAGLVGGLLLYAGLWSPDGGLLLLVGIALGGLAGEQALLRLEGARERARVSAAALAEGPASQLRPLTPDLPPAPFAVIRKRALDSLDGVEMSGQSRRSLPRTDPLDVPTPSRAVQRIIDRAVDELAERYAEGQP